MSQKFQSNPLSDISEKLTSIIEDIVDSKKIKRKPEEPVKNQDELLENLRNTIENECSLGLLEPYSREFTQFHEILEIFENKAPNSFTFLIITRMIGLINQISCFITQVKSAGTLLKEHDIKEHVIDESEKILKRYTNEVDSFHSKQKQIVKYYDDQIIEKPPLFSGPSSTKFYGLPKYHELTTSIDKWWVFSKIKDVKFEIVKKKRDFPTESIFIDFLKKIRDELKKKKRKERFISLSDMMNDPLYSDLKKYFMKYLNTERVPEAIKKITLGDLDGPIFYLLYSREYITKTDGDFKDSLTKKNIKKELKDVIKKAYLKNLKSLSAGLIKSEKALTGKIDKIIPRICLGLERDLESKIQEMEEQGDKQKQELFKKEMKRIYRYLSIQKQWILGLEEYLNDYSDAIDRYLRVLTEVESELERKADEYVKYLDSLIEQNVRSELDNEINKKIETLEELLKEYENATVQIIEKESPESNTLEGILDNFEKKFYSVNKEVEKIFKRYKDNDFNIYNSLIRWEDKFNEIGNKVRFVVSSLFSSFFNKYREVMEKEKSFFARFAKLSSSSDSSTPLSFSLDMLMPEKLTEKQIRERMSNIDVKIKEIETTIDKYKAERNKYEEFLKNLLDKTGHLESKQCVICHKKVDLVEEKYIKCEFCNRLMHYLCGAWWLEKHNSCPVCNNEYIIPNSGLFETDYYDPNQEESIVDFNEQSEDEDYIEIDMDKYPLVTEEAETKESSELKNQKNVSEDKSEENREPKQESEEDKSDDS